MNVHFPEEHEFVRRVRQTLVLIVISLSFVCATTGFLFFQNISSHRASPVPAVFVETEKVSDVWQAPDSTLIPRTAEGDLIRYGRELISHTAKYLGPKGIVRRMSNGMNCQNCHLKGGTKPFANNFAFVASGYPRFRARSGVIETIEKRINDCFQRSLNGETLEQGSREMRAFIAYFNWIGKDVKKGMDLKGSGVVPLSFLKRAADPAKGKLVYTKYCKVCHGVQGAGFKHPDSLEWTYPPLAGPDSYNTGAGMHRLSTFSGYIRSNMPYGTTYENPVLAEEEAWDVAAYINSLPRPQRKFPNDYSDISRKPIDHPFGPYADTFSEQQHKYGPFEEIQNAQDGEGNKDVGK